MNPTNRERCAELIRESIARRQERIRYHIGEVLRHEENLEYDKRLLKLLTG